MRSIFLVGFMGSGKTTFGKKLAARLQHRFVDLDHEVANRYGMGAVNELINQKGFDFFRQAESDTLKEQASENLVIATGGGTPCYFDNLQWMKDRGVVVFLSVDEGIILSRLKTTNLSDRPLLKDLSEDGLKDFIHQKLEERMPFYNEADYTFDPTKEKMEELVFKLKGSA